MGRLRVHGFSISADGYGAGPGQDHDHPLGVGETRLHEWLFDTRTFMTHRGDPSGGTTGIDDRFVARGFEGIGAWILGRNMFGPVRGPWPDHSWRGWWGEDPPFHTPVFVLTHHARASISMEGGTVFHFITEGIEVALEHARAAADGLDLSAAGYRCVEYLGGEKVAHLRLERR